VANHADAIFERPIFRLTDALQHIDVSDGSLEALGVDRLDHRLVIVSPRLSLSYAQCRAYEDLPRTALDCPRHIGDTGSGCKSLSVGIIRRIQRNVQVQKRHD
jgi:hypothetical protein